MMQYSASDKCRLGVSDCLVLLRGSHLDHQIELHMFLAITATVDGSADLP